MYRVYAVLDEQLSLHELLEEKVGRFPRGERQRAVSARLKGFADASQVDVLALLDTLREAGEVDRVQQLWAANAVIFRATPAALAAVAELPEVARIGWDPERDASAYQDILAACPPPAPAAGGPTAEPNLVELQAPDLWGLGYRGQNIALLNIDSGVDYNNPDLAGRIWSNPADPVDGVDNDGNGYVDDHLGWDFMENDNDPFPGLGFFGGTDTHGTNTAGIMVGDGSSGGKLTGMAPRAEMAIARVNGETEHWLAMQYSLSTAMDCSSSSYSYKWLIFPKPDYHMHRQLQDMLLAAGIIHANSIGNQGGDPSFPIPFQISAPGLSPSPWRHPQQTQVDGGVSGAMGCGAVTIGGGFYSFSSHGPSAWENVSSYDAGYLGSQDPAYWDYPVGGFGGSLQGLLKPDVVCPTDVQTTTVGGGYISFGGTSAATPHLGGSFALLLSVNPNAEPRHISQALQVTALDLGTPGKDELYGAGEVQVRDAALRLIHLIKVDDVQPHLGDTVTASVSGNPGALFLSIYGFQPGITVAPGFTLDLAPPFFVLMSGNLDPQGEAQVSFQVPATPTLIGTQVLLQSGEDDSAGATGQILISTLESFLIQS
ncbi:MAG: S8 family serine peptidase [Planctomycetota bacterium]